MEIAISIAIIIVILGLLVTVHELGHFWVATWLKIKAFEVSIFVGPKLLQWKRKDVEYTIRAVPLGAYVRFSEFDEEGNVVQDDDPSLLINQKRWKRLLVALAGPFMNLLLGIFIMTIFFCCANVRTLQSDGILEETQMYEAVQDCPLYSEGDVITHVNGHRVYTFIDFGIELGGFTKDLDTVTLTMRDAETGVSYDVVVDPDPVEKPMMGFKYDPVIENEYDGWIITETFEDANNGDPVLKPEDVLVAINDIPVLDSDAIEEFCDHIQDGDTVVFSFYRDGELHTEESIVNTLSVPKYMNRGCYIRYYKVDSFGHLMLAVKEAAKTPLSIGVVTVRVLQNAFSGAVEPYNVVQGPVGLTASVSEVVTQQRVPIREKVYDLILYSAIISMGLMYSNMLPIPGLDGNQIILLIVESVLGRPISKKAENVISVVGFIILVLLAVFALASDIIRIVVGA